MRLVIAVAALALSACSRPSETATYPPGYELTFMQACQAQGSTQALCACTWDKIEADVAPADFAALDQMSPPEREANPLMRQIAEYTYTCHAELTAEPATAP